MNTDRIRTILALVLMFLGGTFICVGLDDDGDVVVKTETEPVAVVPEAIVVDGADADAKVDDVVELGPEAREVTEDLIEENIGADVQVDEGDDLRGEDNSEVAQLEPPYASESVPGCRTRFLPTNWSSRSGVVPKWMAPHFAANRDIPGSRAEVDGLTAYGSNPAARVSWHFNLDKDGNCDYNVPIKYNAWTISNANRLSINFEVSGAGESPYLRRGGYKQLARIWKYVHAAYPGIPLRVGTVSNCFSGAAGWITHWMTGVCGGSHEDIKPHDLRVVVSKVRYWMKRLDCGATCQAHRRAHRHYQRHAKAGKCRKGVHKTKPSEYKKKHCRNLKLKIKRLHGALS